LLGWLKEHRAGRERRCDECGSTWPVGKPEKPGHFEGFELTPHGHSAAPVMAEQIEHAAEDDAAVRDALGHCPHCGCAHFAEYRVGHEPAGPN
jgi:hypothetical protein